MNQAIEIFNETDNFRLKSKVDAWIKSGKDLSDNFEITNVSVSTIHNPSNIVTITLAILYKY